MKKAIKFILVLVLVALVGYKSVYFRKLSELKSTDASQFDAGTFAKKLWDEKMPAKLDSAIELSGLIRSIDSNATDAFSKYSNAMGIGNYRYSLVKATGIAAIIHEDDVIMQVNHADSLLSIKLATEYVYGNAIRDASALVDIKDFSNTTDLNNISEELNRRVRKQVLPSFKKEVKQGDKIEVTGAIELNKQHINFSNLELIPVRIRIVQ